MSSEQRPTMVLSYDCLLKTLTAAERLTALRRAAGRSVDAWDRDCSDDTGPRRALDAVDAGAPLNDADLDTIVANSPYRNRSTAIGIGNLCAAFKTYAFALECVVDGRDEYALTLASVVHFAYLHHDYDNIWEDLHRASGRDPKARAVWIEHAPNFTGTLAELDDLADRLVSSVP